MIADQSNMLESLSDELGLDDKLPPFMRAVLKKLSWIAGNLACRMTAFCPSVEARFLKNNRHSRW
jgi:hypothetical protein